MATYRHDDPPPHVTKVPVSRKLVEELGLDPAEYATCSRPGEHNVGCQAWKFCRLKERGSGAGPCFKGVAEIKVDGKRKYINNQIRSCYSIPWRTHALEINEGLLEVVANEGEGIALMGSEVIVRDIPGKGPTQEIRDFVGGPNGAKETIVPPYKDENTRDLMARYVAATTYEKFVEKQRSEHQKEAFVEASAPAGSRVGKGPR